MSGESCSNVAGARASARFNMTCSPRLEYIWTALPVWKLKRRKRRAPGAFRATESCHTHA